MKFAFPNPISVSHQIHTYTELRQQIHHDLQMQHPEWIEPNGYSPKCDFYEARLMELLETLTPSENTCDAWGHVTGESVSTENSFPPLAGCDCDLWGHPILRSRLPYRKTTIVGRATSSSSARCSSTAV